jgi:hypothetical protein
MTPPNLTLTHQIPRTPDPIIPVKLPIIARPAAAIEVPVLSSSLRRGKQIPLFHNTKDQEAATEADFGTPLSATMTVEYKAPIYSN